MTEPVTQPVPEPEAEHAPAQPVPEAVPAPDPAPDPVPEAVPEPEPAEPEPVAQPEPEPVPVLLADPAPAPNRRVLRAVARWTAALLVCAGLGTATAYGLTSMERTDVPGLATESDGRWEYPRLSLPALPEGSPRPFSEGNTHEIHHADLRKLLLPAPEGAKPDKELTGGWTTAKQFASEFSEDERAELEQALDDVAVRHIAARGWTMPDGTASRVYLLRFDSGTTAHWFSKDDIGVGADAGAMLKGMTGSEIDSEWDDTVGGNGPIRYVYQETQPIESEAQRQAYVIAGDTIALVVHSRKDQAAVVPFHQTVALQAQLLG
ncbi:hypothetical protein [Streptomyces sp. NPDC004726]